MYGEDGGFHFMKKTRASSIVSTRKIVSGEHLNPNGTLFGGYLMSWMDEVAFICARRFTGQPTCVTVNIDNVTFRNPVRLGEHLLLTSVINHVGHSSMEIQVDVQREDPTTNELSHTNGAHLTFVCLNQNSKPMKVPSLILESPEDMSSNKESRLRVRIRKRLARFLTQRKKVGEELNFNSDVEGSLIRRTALRRIDRLALKLGFMRTHAEGAY
jgi:acyl-CoA hydrolase